MIGTLIGSGIGAIGGILGGISKAKAERKRRQLIKSQLRENENWYQRRYNEDSTQRADAQNSLRIMRDAMNERTNRIAGASAVTGATDEAVALAKNSANQALGATVANISAAGDARKDQIEQQYQENKQNLNAALGNAYAVQGQNTADAISNFTGTIPGLVEGLEGILSKKQ